MVGICRGDLQSAPHMQVRRAAFRSLNVIDSLKKKKHELNFQYVEGDGYTSGCVEWRSALVECGSLQQYLSGACRRLRGAG